MSNPYPTAELTKLDLEIYLNGLQKRIDHYRVEQQLRPDEYNLKEIKKLSKMAVEAIARFHNQ